MPKFRFVALDSQGRETEGVLDAESQARAISLIKQKGYFPTSVSDIGGGATVKAENEKAAGLGSMELKVPTFVTDAFAGHVKPKQLMVITRQMATLLTAGVPLLRGLQILLKQETHPTLCKALKSIGESVESGSTFAEALALQPKVFTHFYVNMVRAGEAGGVLEDVLARLAEFMEKAEHLKNQIKGAMVYPIIVLVIAVSILVFMMIKIIPKFAEVFSGMLGAGAKLPALTRGVMACSGFLLTKGHYLLIILAAITFGIKSLGKTRRGRYLLDTLRLKAPVFGNLFRLTSVAHFGRTLGTLLNSGVPILQALNIVSETSGNAVISRAITSVHDSVKEGESMALPMDESGVFPLMAISMVEVGEETGSLPDMLTRVAETYESEVDIAVEAMTSIIEPIMIVMLAGIVGTIVVAMFMPLISLMQQLGG